MTRARVWLGDEVTGEVILRRDDDRLYVERADPRILVADPIVAALRDGTFYGSDPPHGHGLFLDGDVLTIRAANRTVIYRIVGYDPERFAWVAEWPD